MASWRGGKPYWSVYDAFKSLPPTPDCLMAEVDAAIAAVEYAQAIDFLKNKNQDNAKPSSSSSASRSATSPSSSADSNEVRIADEAYRSACVSLACGDFQAALASLRVALANCPPEKTTAISKIQSLIAIASQQPNKSSR